MTDPKANATAPMPDITPEPPEPRWLLLLRQACQDDPRGQTGVAAKLPRPGGYGKYKTYSRAYITQALRGLDKKPRADVFVQVVLDAFGSGRIDCPHLRTDISAPECQTNAATPWVQIANTGYERLDLWRACQNCPHNPANNPANKPKATP